MIEEQIRYIVQYFIKGSPPGGGCAAVLRLPGRIYRNGLDRSRRGRVECDALASAADGRSRRGSVPSRRTAESDRGTLALPGANSCSFLA